MGAGCGWTHLVQLDSGRSLQDTWNVAETEGRVLIGPLGALCQRNCAREAKRKRLIPLKYNECVNMHTSVPLTAGLCVCLRTVACKQRWKKYGDLLLKQQ